MCVTQVSSKRVIDGVPMHLRHYLLRQFCNELEDLPIALTTGTAARVPRPSGSVPLGFTDGDGDEAQGDAGIFIDAAQLMAEDPSTAERRALQRQVAQWQSVRKILSVF